MNNLAVLLILLTPLISCSRKSDSAKAHEQYQLSIDSTFLKTYKVVGLNKVETIKNIVIGNNDAIFETAKTKLEFYEFKTIQVTNSITAKIVLSAFAPDFRGDGTLRLVYLVTINPAGEQLDILRIGKDEEISDIFEFETSLIKNDTIRRWNNYMHVEDSLGIGVAKQESFDNFFIITPDGKITSK